MSCTIHYHRDRDGLAIPDIPERLESELCQEEGPEGFFQCTRPSRHEGPHVASGTSYILMIWSVTDDYCTTCADQRMVPNEDGPAGTDMWVPCPDCGEERA